MHTTPVTPRRTERKSERTGKMQNDKLRGEYFLWLCQKIAPLHLIKKRFHLLETLYSKEFYSIVPNDDNRVEDGIKLREDFFDDTIHTIPSFLPCSVLEMLIALAHRMDHILFDNSVGEQTGKWFWIMVGNLRLKADGKDMYDVEKQGYINDIILEAFLERQYGEDGGGELHGLFPLKKALGDQKKVEIWYQMMQYIDENYECC